MDHLNNETLLEEPQTILLERLDTKSADGVFLIRKLQGIKTQAELDEVIDVILPLREDLNVLHQTLLVHSKRHTMRFKIARKRISYVLKCLNTEQINTERRIARELKLKNAKYTQRDSIINAKLLAKFLVNEAIKLNLEHVNKEDKSDLRVSRAEVPKEPVITSALEQALALSSSEELLIENAMENSLSRMDETL